MTPCPRVGVAGVATMVCGAVMCATISVARADWAPSTAGRAAALASSRRRSVDGVSVFRGMSCSDSVKEMKLYRNSRFSDRSV